MLSLLELLKESYSKKIQLNEGGASGHMIHLFEDGSMTFGDLKEIFKQLFSGEIEVSEKCLSPDTLIQLKNNGIKKISEVVDNKIDDEILSYDESGEKTYKKIVAYANNGECSEWVKITLDDGTEIICTPNHRIYLPATNSDVKANELKVGDTLLHQ